VVQKDLLVMPEILELLELVVMPEILELLELVVLAVKVMLVIQGTFLWVLVDLVLEVVVEDQVEVVATVPAQMQG
jgi:hypothetical protein